MLIRNSFQKYGHLMCLKAQKFVLKFFLIHFLIADQLIKFLQYLYFVFFLSKIEFYSRIKQIISLHRIALKSNFLFY